MTCNFTQAARLLCSSTDDVEQIDALTVYFKSDTGEERRVVRCVQHEDFECDNEGGFGCTRVTLGHAEVTLPETFKQTGSFRCQIAGVDVSDIKRCPWPPEDSISRESPPSNDILPNFRQDSSLTSPTEQKDFGSAAEGNSSALTAGVVVGVLLIAAILIITLIVLRKHRKRSGGPQESTLEGGICNTKDLQKRPCWWWSKSRQNDPEAQIVCSKRDSKPDNGGSLSPLLAADSPKQSSGDGIQYTRGDKADDRQKMTETT